MLDDNRAGLQSLLFGFAQNAFNADRLVEQVWAGLAFEAHEAIEIEDVACAAEVREISELDRGDGDLVRDIFELFFREVRADLVFLQTLAPTLFIIFDRVLSHDNQLNIYEKVVTTFYKMLKLLCPTEEKAFGLDTSIVEIERVPLIVSKPREFDSEGLREAAD